MILRKVGLDDNGPLSALLLLGAMTGAFAGGMVLKGKSGWCSTVCPLLPVQRIYGQTPFALVGNNHCQPCVGCAKSCYDFNPRAAYLADLNDADGYWSGYRKFFVGAFPGLVLGFFETADGDVAGMLLYMAVSIALFALAITFVKVSAHTITRRSARSPSASSTGRSPARWSPATWPMRAAAIALAGVWLLRTWRKEKPFLAQAAAPVVAVAAGGAASRSIANNRALKSGAPEVHFVPEDKRVAAKEGLCLLEIAESNGMTIESGCRMGICGADPVAIKDGHGVPERHLRRREGDARAARPRAQHPHGLLRARPGPRHRRAEARQGRGAQPEQGRGLLV